MSSLTLLGQTVSHYPNTPDEAKLETFPNPRGGEPLYTIEFSTSEFTSRCPVTGQPDFGALRIRYSPRFFCLESKSLKLYLGAFREEKAFWEALVNKIALTLEGALRPHWIEVTGTMNPRGGIGMVVRVRLGDYPKEEASA